MIVVGCGALNLDLIYEVEDIGLIARHGFGLSPGRECIMDHHTADRMLHYLANEGKLLGKSGGGSSANTLCALSKMGYRAYFIGSVGEDEAGQYLLESMEEVDCSLITKSGKSSMCIIVIDRLSNDRAMAVVPGTLSIETDNLKMETVLKNARLFHMSSFVQEKGPTIHGELLGLCGQDCLVTFDPGEIYAEKGYSAIKDLLDQSALLFSSDVEFEAIFRGKSIMEVLSKGLLGRYIRRSCCNSYNFFQKMPGPVIAKKLGAKGALLASSGLVIKCPAQKVEKIADNTGAGDAFDAGLIDAIFKNKNPQNALEEAISIATFSLMFTGRQWIDHLEELRVSPH